MSSEWNVPLHPFLLPCMLFKARLNSQTFSKDYPFLVALVDPSYKLPQLLLFCPKLVWVPRTLIRGSIQVKKGWCIQFNYKKHLAEDSPGIMSVWWRLIPKTRLLANTKKYIERRTWRNILGKGHGVVFYKVLWPLAQARESSKFVRVKVTFRPGCLNWMHILVYLLSKIDFFS